MARKVLIDLDLVKNQLLNARIQNLASAPGSPVAGQIYYDTTLNQQGYYNGSTWIYAGSGSGDASTNTATSVDGEVVLFNGTTGKSVKRATGSGIVKVTSGVFGTATSATDYAPATSGTSILKASSGGFANAVSGTDYAPATGTTSSLKGNGSGGFSAATLNDNGAPTADFSMNSHKLTSVLDPTAAQDAATKNYVDTYAQGLDMKQSVRVATTANGTLSTAFANSQTVDGVTLATGDRILLKNQTTGADNGIYIVAASGAPTRATDADATGELTAGAITYVESGTANGSQQWVLTTTGVITIGTTSQTWTQFSGASTLTAGGGLTATGNVFAVGAGTGIVVNTDTVTVDRATNGSTVPFKYTATIGDGSTTAIAVTHSLGTQDVVAQVRDASSNVVVECDMTQTSTSVTTFTFTTAPATNAYKVVIIG